MTASLPAPRRAELDHAGCLRLAAAVILSAVQDAMSASQEVHFPARRWLAEDGPVWFRAIGINEGALRKWLRQGCPSAVTPPYQSDEDRYHELIAWCATIAASGKRKRKRRR